MEARLLHRKARRRKSFPLISDIGIEHNVDAPLLRFSGHGRTPTLGGCEEFPIELPDLAIRFDVWPFHICFFLSLVCCAGAKRKRTGDCL